MSEGIPKRWKVLSGKDKWKDLLDPLDIDLRHYIIHYGERAQATSDTFDHEEVSRYAGSSIYKPEVLFKHVGLSKNNPFKYGVVRYVYATSQISLPACFIIKSQSKDPLFKESNFMGYVAVATDEGKTALGRRDILVAWRGTARNIEWAKNFDYPLLSASEILGEDSNANVHQGFLSIYTSSDPKSTYTKDSARVQVLDEIKSLLEKFKNEEVSITITGHSLGAGLATLNAIDIVANGYNQTIGQSSKSCMVTAFVFGSPRVGDSDFKDAFESMNDLHLLRIRNTPDLVPMVPPIPYVHVGEELEIDSLDSPYLKPTVSLEMWHNLEAAYLHTIAGTQGSKGGFHFEVKREIALANKRLDALEDEYLVPVDWWCLKNKGMVQKDDGSWKLEDYDRND